MEKILLWFCNLFGTFAGRRVLLVDEYGHFQILKVCFTKSGKGYVKYVPAGFYHERVLFLDNVEQKDGELRSSKGLTDEIIYNRWFSI